jgi:hypothetical protein
MAMPRVQNLRRVRLAAIDLELNAETHSALPYKQDCGFRPFETKRKAICSWFVSKNEPVLQLSRENLLPKT